MEDLVREGARFDVVLAMEVVEHVADVPAFVAAAASLIKPGGLFALSTLNRTFKSFALAVVGAEYVLRWLAPGTHHWEQFVTPDELAAALRAAGLEVTQRRGMSYDPLRGEWRLSRDLGGELFHGGEAGLNWPCPSAESAVDLMEASFSEASPCQGRAFSAPPKAGPPILDREQAFGRICFHEVDGAGGQGGAL